MRPTVMTEAIPFSAVSDKEFVAIDGLSIGVGPYWIGEIVTRGTKLRSRFYILKDRLEMREKSRSACLNTSQDPSLPSRILMWKAEVYNIIKVRERSKTIREVILRERNSNRQGRRRR